MHRGDSFGSRLEDFTSAFHICNDRAPREARWKRGEEEEEEEGGEGPGPGKREREGAIEGRAKERRRKKKTAGMEGEVEEGGRDDGEHEAQEYGPHLDAWDRHPRSLHQRTDSHRAHAALTYSRVLRRGDSLS